MTRTLEPLLEVSDPACVPALPFEALWVGRCWRSGELTVEPAWIRQFADLTGDQNPIHIDPGFARKTFWRGVIAHGMLIASLAAGKAYRGGLLGPNVLALEASSMSYLNPVRPGDRLICEVSIRAADAGAGKRFGRVVWHNDLYKLVDGKTPQLVLNVEWTTLIFKAEFMPQPSALARV